MKFNNVDFNDYFKNYPDKNGFFGNTAVRISLRICKRP